VGQEDPLNGIKTQIDIKYHCIFFLISFGKRFEFLSRLIFLFAFMAFSRSASAGHPDLGEQAGAMLIKKLNIINLKNNRFIK
jgi:hypothetical protein